MKIVLVKGEKALSVNSEFCKGVQPFTETGKNLIFEYDKSSTCSSEFHMLLLYLEPRDVICQGCHMSWRALSVLERYTLFFDLVFC